MNVLFVCSKNEWRSRTAETIFQKSSHFKVKSAGTSKTARVRINQRLIELARDRKQVVLVVDEAQAMPRETIESLRLLTNLETEKRKLLQVVLIGQPELEPSPPPHRGDAQDQCHGQGSPRSDPHP